LLDRDLTPMGTTTGRISSTQPMGTVQVPKTDTSLTTNPNDPRLTRGIDRLPGGQAKAYLVLPVEQRKTHVRPYRDAYIHTTCPSPAKPPNITITVMSRGLAETYAADPGFYGATFCRHCNMHRPVQEFVWYEMDGTIGPVVGT
jgi:hypothetical protein